MYFDENNNYFEDYKNMDIDIDIDSINFNRNNNLYPYEEGFNKGTLFKDIYSKYKNHVYKLNVSSEKDKLLLNIQMYNFALKDLNLYLDVHPTDQSMLVKFNSVKNKLKDLKREYANKYGPLCASENDSTDKWTWINNPWPWDKGGK